jgi:hypothetical protein
VIKAIRALLVRTVILPLRALTISMEHLVRMALKETKATPVSKVLLVIRFLLLFVLTVLTVRLKKI